MNHPLDPKSKKNSPTQAAQPPPPNRSLLVASCCTATAATPPCRPGDIVGPIHLQGTLTASLPPLQPPLLLSLLLLRSLHAFIVLELRAIRHLYPRRAQGGIYAEATGHASTLGATSHGLFLRLLEGPLTSSSVWSNELLCLCVDLYACSSCSNIFCSIFIHFC